MGGGNGWQASILASWGCDVVSIDIPGHLVPSRQYFPVQDYDGSRFPFCNEQFDLVFSSNVLEHIYNLPGVLDEVKRVLKPDGLAIHVLPTSSWRFYTSLAHYGYLVAWMVGLRKEDSKAEGRQSLASIVQKKGWLLLLKRGIASGPHGEYPNAISELYYFSRRRWLALFASNGFDAINWFETGIFYTGYSLFKSISIKRRQRLSVYLGSSTNVYTMRK